LCSLGIFESKEKKRTGVNRGAVAEINLSALRHNLAAVGRIAGKRPVIAVVKADAYGHGAVEVSKRLLSEGVSALAVAFSGEGRALREQGISAKIIVLFDRTEISDYFEYGLTPVIQDLKTADEFSKEARRRGVRISVHLKVDTGMGRIGIRPEHAVAAALEISEKEGIEIEGLMSHFSEADLSDRSYAGIQLKLFNDIRKDISQKIGRTITAHMGNSAAVLSLKEALFDAVRPGIILYGCSPFAGEDFGCLPLMRIKTKVLAVRCLPAGCPVSYGRTFVTERASKIAVLPVGYADGYDRLFSNNAEVIIRGVRAPVVGRVCMDVTMADVTSIEGVSEGDEVVLLGRQGNENITAEELASRIRTIPYDIVTSLGSRSRKEYIG
jgi:alanine racemase